MSQNYLASRSSNLSSFNAIAMNYSTLTVSTLSGVSTLNVSRVITTSTIQVNSSMISLGNSTNQVYVSSLSYGNFSTSSTWATSLTNRLSTATVLMSANAQYQMTVSPSTTVSSIMYTSTLGSSWTTLSAATGLPSATATSYTAGAVSGDGRYGALGTYGGYLYTTANSGTTWTNTNPNTPAIYLPLNGSVTDIIGTSNPSVQGTNAGSISYVPGIVGTRAINLINTPVGTATQYVRGTWVAVSNFSVSLWCNPQSASASMIIFAIGNALQIQTNGTSGLQLQAPGISSSVSYPVATNTWYNITVIFQANSTCYFYVNNVLIASPTSTGSVPSGSYSLGTYDTGTSNAFNGYIDDFKIYNSAITFTPMVPQNWSSTAVSNTGQYMLATATGAGLYMSSNFGSTWTQVTGAMLSAIWSAAQVSASGQYMLAYSMPVMVQPQLTGLTGNITTTSPVYTSWQTNGITWTSFCSSIVDNNATFQAWCAFNNLGNSVVSPYSWASARNYDATTGAYTGSLSTIIQSVASQTGEWIQLQSSVPVVLYSYNFACGSAAAIPKTYFIIGSNDGSTWYPIQSVSIGTNPFTTGPAVATSAPIIVNQSGSQTMTAGTSGTLTCTTYTTNTTAAYTYFRLIGTSTFGPTAARCCEFTELYLNFQAGGQTYSTNYGSTWNNGYALPTPTALSLSESGQYAIGANAPQILAELNFEGTAPAAYADSIALGNLTYSNVVRTALNINTSIFKVGSSSVQFTHSAGTATPTYINYTVSSFFNAPNAYTISAWIYPTATPVGGYGIAYAFTNNVADNIGTYVYIDTSNRIGCVIYTSTLQSYDFNAPAIALNNWHHVAVVISYGTVYLYVNGVMQASRTYTGVPSLQTGGVVPTNFIIGAGSPSSLSYQGYVDNLRIYNTALSQSQINTLYTTPATAALTVPPVYITSNFLQGFSTGTSTTPTFQTPLNAATNNHVASAVSNTGQYMVIITNNVSGNNVYYSINFGAYFAGLQLGTTLLTSCAISYDGSYITVSNATTTWTLNNNSNGFSLALGNQAGYQNQGQNAIAIGNGAGSINQTANSIILNASGAAVNAFAPGFYVAPIASYVASSSQSFGLLGYGTDSQVVQIGNVSMTSNILTLNSGLSLTGTVYGSTNASAAFWMQANGGTSLYITDSQNSPTMGTTTMGRYFGVGGNIFQDFFGSFIWRTSNLSNTAVNNAMTLSSTGVLTVSNVSIFGNSVNTQIRIGENSLVSAGGQNNMSIGINNGRTAGTGGNNILVGMLVGQAMTTGANNMIFGLNAGNLITSGVDNCLFGLNSGNTLNTGQGNTCMGTGSGLRINSGGGNTIIGKDSGNFLTTGNWNTAVGERALTNLATATNTGDFNSAFGHFSLRDLTTGSYNTGLGSYSGSVLTSGSTNTYVGWNTIASSGAVNNEVVIGDNLTGYGSNTTLIKGHWGSNLLLRGTGGQNNRGGVFILGPGSGDGVSLVLGSGNNANAWNIFTSALNVLCFTNSAGGTNLISMTNSQNGLVSVSDRRFKKDISFLENALSIVKQLKPSFFRYKDASEDSNLRTGFIAQETLEILPEAVDTTDPERFGINYTAFIPYLTRSIQEQQQQIVNQQAQIDALIQRLTAANIA